MSVLVDVGVAVLGIVVMWYGSDRQKIAGAVVVVAAVFMFAAHF